MSSCVALSFGSVRRLSGYSQTHTPEPSLNCELVTLHGVIIQCGKCEHFDNSKRSLHLKQPNLFRNQTFTEHKVFLPLLACSISCPAALTVSTRCTHVALCISTWHAINSVRNSWPQIRDLKIMNCTITVCPNLSLL